MRLMAYSWVFPSSSVYHSPRIEGLVRSKTEFATALDFDIAASKDHWSELQSPSGAESIAEASERVVLTNAEIVRSLRRQYPQSGHFFDFDLLEMGKKIAEGAQAEIFEAKHVGVKFKYALKVFKEGASVMDLQKQWPLEMLNRCGDHGMYGLDYGACSPVLGGTVLMNGRFAFWMFQYAGDLRKLTDQRMERNNNRYAPFSDDELEKNMLQIAKGMEGLHMDNIVHRDLKASNVLVRSSSERLRLEDLDSSVYDQYSCRVADFECSVGVVGTRFWRAPEILQGVKDHRITPDLFTKEADVYSYAMTCYEMITGRLPFEGVGLCDYDVVLGGQRPELPEETKPWIKTLVRRCWGANPLERPNFEEIVKRIEECGKKVG